MLDDPPRDLLAVAARRGTRGERVTFRVATERHVLERLIDAGVPAGEVELLIAREWAILANENDYTTEMFQQITGRPPRRLAEFLHEHCAEFL